MAVECSFCGRRYADVIIREQDEKMPYHTYIDELANKRRDCPFAYSKKMNPI